MRQGNFTELLSSTGTGTATSVPIQAICPNLYGSGGAVLPQFAAGYGYVSKPSKPVCLSAGTHPLTPRLNINIVPASSQMRPA